MKIRSELNALAADIRLAACCWTGGSKVQIGDTQTTIAKIAQKILDSLNQYPKEEKCLKARIATAENLSKALNELKFKSQNPDREHDLILMLRKVNEFINSSKKRRDELGLKVSENVDIEIKNKIKDVQESFLQKIKNVAFRLVKDVKETERIHANRIEGSALFSFFTLKNDLEAFHSFYKGILTTSQQSQIQECLSILEIAANLDQKIVGVFELMHKHKVPNDVVDSRIADIAFEIEQSIENLGVNERFVFPGGYVFPGNSHAVVFEVLRARENEFHFSIFNTGAGADFGQPFVDNIGKKLGSTSQTKVPLFTNLPKEAVSEQNFLIELIQYQVHPTRGMSPVIESIVNQFTQKFQGIQTTRESHELQTWGTCAHDSVDAFLEYFLPPSLFTPFHYDMLLRARGELSALLASPEAAKILPKETLEFIDRKSCEYIGDLKVNFEDYCYPYRKGDSTIASMVNITHMKDQEDLKRLLEMWSDHDIADEKKVGVDFYDKTFLSIMWYHNKMPLLEPGSDLKIFALPLGLNPYHFVRLFRRAVITPSFDMRRAILWHIQDLIKRESPEAAKILEMRNQALGNGNQPVFTKEIDLSSVFNYLKKRSEIFSLCVDALLNSAYSPLSQVSNACANLPSKKIDSWIQQRITAIQNF